MDIKSISGADIMPAGVLENSKNYTENASTLERKEGEKSVMVRDETRGNNIDTTA